MHLIEPCCAQRHLALMRKDIKDGGTTQFEGYGDLSLSELLGPLLTRYSETEMMIVAPTLPCQAAEVINKWMRKQWARMDGKGMLDVLRHLTIIASLDKESDCIGTWLKRHPFGERLTLVDTVQEDTAILLPDFAITGPVNMRYGHHFVATATTDPKTIESLWEKYRTLVETESRDDETTTKTVATPKAKRKKSYKPKKS